MATLVLSKHDLTVLSSLDIPENHILIVAGKAGDPALALCNVEFEQALATITEGAEHAETEGPTTPHQHSGGEESATADCRAGAPGLEVHPRK